MTYNHVYIDKVGGGVGVVTLNRPHRLNALSNALLIELKHVLTSFENDDDVQCVVITGAGKKAFSAGADIHEMAALPSDGPIGSDQPPEDFWWDLATSTKPTIGAVNGLAYGGAAMLASSLDIRIGCERSSFRFLAASYGRINSTWSLPLVVGWAKAKELLYTARIVHAEEALEIGLLNKLVPAEELLNTAVEMGRAIAANSSEAVQEIKRLLIEDLGRTWREMYVAERTAIASFEATPLSEAFKDFLSTRGSSSTPRTES